MPKKSIPLSATEVKNAKPKDKLYKLSDGGGLQLWVYPNGIKKWALTFRRVGKQQTIYQQYPIFSLAEARLWREQTKAKLVKGEPVTEKEIEKHIVCTVFEEWLSRWKPEVSEKYGKQVENAIRRDILPVIGKMDIREVRPLHIVDALRAFEERDALEYLRRTKTGLNQVFDFAISRGLIDMNPVASVSNKAFKKHKPTNFRALKPDELPMLITTVEEARRARRGTITTYYAFYWQLLTMTRPNETASAKWEDIDLDSKLWTIPAQVMKMKRPHRIPLTPILIDLLEDIRMQNIKGVYLFEGQQKEHINAETVLKMFKRLEIDSTAHGLRSLARTYLRETRKFKRDALEMCLAHITGTATERSYDRSELLDERREIIDYWSEIVYKLKKS